MDIYSFYGATMLSLLLAGCAMIVTALAYKQVPGFASAGLGCLLLGVALGVILLRVVVPGKSVILASDILLVASAKYWVDGVRVFRGKPRVTALVAAAVCAVFLAGIVYWLYVDERQAMRTGLVSALFAAALFSSGITMVSPAPDKDRAVYWWTGGVFLLDGVCLLVRTGAAFLGLTSGRLFGEGPIETVTLVAVNLGAIGCGFGLLTASNLRFVREIEGLALHDPLTQLPNRRFFEERFLEAGRRASRTGRRLALIYMDIDGFKPINDRLGHGAGDDVLKMVAQRVAAESRESDCVARLGGDEFVLLLEDAGDRDELGDLIRRLQACVREDFMIAGEVLRVKVSCGLAVFPDDVESVEQLVGRADLSMYDSKRGVRV